MHRPSLIAVTVIAALSLGCSDGGPGNEGSGGHAGASSTSTGGGGQQGGGGAGGGTSSASGGGGNGGAGSSPLVINEISATGTDWVELGNPTASDVDLEGLSLADSDSKGDPDISHATTFASGASIAAHTYALVVAGQDDDGDGKPQTKCLDQGGPATCFYATWKISSSDGDEVFLVDKDGKVLGSVPYPKNAVADGQTYGRLPDMTGPFTATAATPGAPNQVP
jgi:hypothetical protein